MSKEWWDGLDPAVQELMTEIAEEFMFEAALPLVEEMEAEACETILASGGTVEIFPDEEVETVRERVGDVSADRWLQGAVDQGVPVEAAESFRSAFLEKYAGYEGQMPYDSGMKACAER